MNDVNAVEIIAQVICISEGCDSTDCHERCDAARAVIRAIRTDPALQKALGVVMMLSAADPDKLRERFEQLTELLRQAQRQSVELRTLTRAAANPPEDSPGGLPASQGQEVKRTHDHWRP